MREDGSDPIFSVGLSGNPEIIDEIDPMGKLRKIILATAGLATAAVLVAVGASGCGGGSSPATSSGKPAASQDKMRTLIVSSGREPTPSSPGSTLHALRLKGSVPSRPTVATVMTDENCAPDAHGVSHCVNRIRLPGGTLVVRHPHRMMEVPCLEPGEHIMVRGA